MATLFRNSWPIGWIPNADEINGDVRGLLRSDNLTHDEDGVIGLIRGTKKVSGAMPSEPTQIYGKLLDLNSVIDSPGGYPNGPNHLRYLVLGNQVIRNFGSLKNENAYDEGIISGGGDQGAAFGFGSGHIFITYGPQKVKDSGVKRTPIGMSAAAPPGLSYNSPPSINMRGPNSTYVEWAIKEAGGPPDGSGTDVFVNTSDYVEIGTSEENRAVAVAGQFVTIAIDGTALNGITGSDRSDDTYKINVRINNTSTLIKFRIEYLLQQPEVIGFNPDATDYFWYEWSGESGVFNAGINTWTTLECKRSDFQRQGTESALGWKDIKGIRAIFVATEYQQNAFTDPKFIGGTKGPLNNTYTYIQVNVQDNGYYTEKSLMSIQSVEVNPINTSIHVIPSQLHMEATEAWIFRGGSSLGGFYRIKAIPATGGSNPTPFDDSMSDEQALALNIQLDYYQQNLPDGIIGMETNFKGRNWYMTYERIYPSYRDNVSSYDSRYVIDTAGNTEYNLFITKLSTDAMILATNKDFYEISGSAGVITQDNIEYFDLVVRPLGIKTPSISKSFAVREGNLFYLASDGIRVLAGTSCQLVTNEIDLLFNNYNRYGISPTKMIPNEPIYHLGIGNNRLYFSTQLQNNKRALFIYTFADKLWRLEDHGDTDSINALFVEEDDTVIYSTASFGDKFVRILDTGTLFDESNPINFKFLTPYDHNGQPRNRKDTFTLKIIADTGNIPIDIKLNCLRDDKTVATYTTTRAFDGRSEHYFNVYTELFVVKYYQLELSGTVPNFKLYSFSIDYESRPEQVNVLRIPPSNFSTVSRKRINEIPMVLDTLGKDITFIPILDGVAQTPAILNTADRYVVNYLIGSNKTAYNIGGLLTSPTGDVFEFYELTTPREIEILPDPVIFKHVPYTNLGTTSRKRFIQYAIVINTNNAPVEMSVIVDGIIQSPITLITDGKQTFIATFNYNLTGIDICCELTSGGGVTPFEFYQVSLDDCVFEKLPPISKYTLVPYSNLGTTSRKKFIQYAIVIDTRGQNVSMSPHIDGVDFPQKIINTNAKRTVIMTFEGEATGVDIGCTLKSLTETPFEFYGLSLDESVFEKLPPASRFIQLPSTNYGCATRKRIRTIPFTINTKGGVVKYTPKVDGVTFPSSTFTTNDKGTVLYYFTDSQPDLGVPFGIDYGGTLESSTDFEFYEMLPPANVEILPMGKMFDQIGPIEFSKVGKIREVSIRLVATTSIMNFKIFSSDVVIIRGSIPTVINREKTYVVSLPKGINPNIFRMELDSAAVFHRFEAEVKINIDGGQTQNKKIKLTGPAMCGGYSGQG